MNACHDCRKGQARSKKRRRREFDDVNIIDHKESITGFDYNTLSSNILTGRGPEGDDHLQLA